jgi:hypothetical protein
MNNRWLIRDEVCAAVLKAEKDAGFASEVARGTIHHANSAGWIAGCRVFRPNPSGNPRYPTSLISTRFYIVWKPTLHTVACKQIQLECQDGWRSDQGGGFTSIIVDPKSNSLHIKFWFEARGGSGGGTTSIALRKNGIPFANVEAGKPIRDCYCSACDEASK